MGLYPKTNGIDTRNVDGTRSVFEDAFDPFKRSLLANLFLDTIRRARFQGREMSPEQVRLSVQAVVARRWERIEAAMMGSWSDSDAEDAEFYATLAEHLARPSPALWRYIEIRRSWPAPGEKARRETRPDVPMSEPQRRFLWALGYRGETPSSSKEASAIIASLLPGKSGYGEKGGPIVRSRTIKTGNEAKN